MLDIRNISCGYGDRTILRGLSLQVEPGCLTGVIGPNGSGKSTLIRAVSGLLPLGGGQVLVAGRPLSSYTPTSLARTLAVLAQDIHLDFDFSVREVVMMGRYPHLDRLQPEGADDRRIADAAMADTDTGHLADRPVTALSGGERQRVLLARCLAQQSRLLLLDEPTSHLDIGHQLEVVSLLTRIAEERRLAVLGVFHDLNLAARSCRRLLLLHDGSALALGTPEAVLTPANIRRAFGIEAAVEPSRHTGLLQVEPVIACARRNHGQACKS